MPLDAPMRRLFLAVMLVAPFGDLLALSQDNKLLTIPKLLMLGFAGLWLWRGLLEKTPRLFLAWFQTAYMNWLWVMIVAYFVSFLWAPSLGNAVKPWIRLISLMVFITIIAEQVNSRAMFRKVVVVLLLGALFAGSLGLYEMVSKKSALSLFGKKSYLHTKTTSGEDVASHQTVTDSSAMSDSKELVIRVQGPQDDPNIHACYLTVLAGLALGQLLVVTGLPARLAVLGLLALVAANVLGTNSRTGFVSVGLTVATFLCLAPYAWKRYALVLLALAALASPAIIANLDKIIPNYDSFHLASVSESSRDPRIDAWLIGLKIIRLHPLLGIGIGNFMEVYMRYRPALYIQIVQPVQNTFIEIWAEGGLVAFLSYVAFQLTISGQLLRVTFSGKLDPARRVFAAGLLAGMIGVLPLHIAQENIWEQEFVWMFYGLACFVLFGQWSEPAARDADTPPPQARPTRPDAPGPREPVLS